MRMKLFFDSFKFLCISICVSITFVIPSMAGYTGAIVDLGRLDWYYNSTNKYFYAYLSDKQTGLSNLWVDNTQYTSGQGNTSLQNLQYCGGQNDKYIYLKNTTYTTTATLKSALAGIYVYYQRTSDKSWSAPEIEIATTKYIDDKFAQVSTNLDTAIKQVKNVVDNTIIQADRINALYEGKQNRPDDYNTKEECPIYEQCLLISDEKGVPHWWPIIVPGTALIKEKLKEVKEKSGIIQPDELNLFFMSQSDGHQLPFDNNAFQKDFPSAESLAVGEWAILYHPDMDYPLRQSIIYGEAHCLEIVESPYLGQVLSTDKAEEFKDFVKAGKVGRQCWCNMTKVLTDGSVYPISGGKVVFASVKESETECVHTCAPTCSESYRVEKKYKVIF